VSKLVLCKQIGALTDHYLLTRRGRSSVSKRLAPKRTAALNADTRASINNMLRSLQKHNTFYNILQKNTLVKLRTE